MDRLSEANIQAKVADLKGWTQQDDSITKTYQLVDFKQAVSFIVAIGFKAEAMDHHPTITNTYNKVTIELTSHDAGGVTERDTELAAKIEEIAKGSS